MPSLSAARAANAQFSPHYLPVALFVGGTSGIGQGTAEAFARHTQGNAHIILCGRNRAAAEAIIAGFPAPSVAADAPLHEFVQCDATRMVDVHAATRGLLARLPKLNFLVLSPGILTIRGGRDETEEGIDRKLALHYYARFKFAYDLLPLLQKATDAGEDAKVMSILGAGRGGKINLDDLGLKHTYSLATATSTVKSYTDCMIEELAVRNPTMAFTHIWPGAVRTPLLRSSHWSFRVISPLIDGLLYPITVSPEDCGEYMLHALLSGEKGAFRRGSKGDDIGATNLFTSPEARKKVWEHSVKVTTVPVK